MSEFFNLVRTSFDYHAPDPYNSYLTELFEDHAKGAVGKSVLAGLAALELSIDIDQVRLSDDEDFNAGPYAFAGIPLKMDSAQFSLLPSLVGDGTRNMTPHVGLVSQDDDLFYAGGLRNPHDLDLPLSEEFEYFIGSFGMPSKLQDFSPAIIEPLVTYFLGYLSYGLAIAFGQFGLRGYRESVNEFEPFVRELWRGYIRDLEVLVENLAL